MVMGSRRTRSNAILLHEHRTVPCFTRAIGVTALPLSAAGLPGAGPGQVSKGRKRLKDRLLRSMSRLFARRRIASVIAGNILRGDVSRMSALMSELIDDRLRGQVVQQVFRVNCRIGPTGGAQFGPSS